MSSKLSAALFVSLALFAATAGAQQGQPGQTAPPKAVENPWFVGGAVGLSFGSEVNYIEFSPIVGYQIVPRFQMASRLTFRYRKDKRYEPDLSTTDIGASILGRYFVWGPVFIQGEVERLQWEYFARTDTGDVVTIDSTYTGLYAGAGFVLGASPKSAMYMSFLWDFNYEDSVPNPNGDPLIIRIGYGFRF